MAAQNAVGLAPDANSSLFELDYDFFQSTSFDEPLSKGVNSNHSSPDRLSQIERDIAAVVEAAALRIQNVTQSQQQLQQEIHDAAQVGDQPPIVPISTTTTTTTSGVANGCASNAVSSSPIAVASSSPARHGLTASCPMGHKAGRVDDEDDDEDLVVQMEILLGEGKSETIEVHLSDQPEQLAQTFAAKHNLKPEAIPKLVQHIQENRRVLLETQPGPSDEDGEEDDEDDDEDNHDLQTISSTGSSSCAPQPFPLSATATPSSVVAPMSPMARLFHPPPAPSSTPATLSATPPSSMPLAMAPPSGTLSSLVGYSSTMDIAAPEYSTTASSMNSLLDPSSAQAAAASEQDTSEQEDALVRRQKTRQQREFDREVRYNRLLDKYNPHVRHDHDSDSANDDPVTRRTGARRVGEDDFTTERLRRRVSKSSRRPTNGTTRSSSLGSSSAAFNRLYALADCKDKWLQRMQHTREQELDKEIAQTKVHLSSKTKQILSQRTNCAVFAHAGDRLYSEAMNEISKKARASMVRKQTIQEQQMHCMTWTCPKCTFVNNWDDESCTNVIASSPLQQAKSNDEDHNQSPSLSRSSPQLRQGERQAEHGHNWSSSRHLQLHNNSTHQIHNHSFNRVRIEQELDQSVACGYPKPKKLFTPTLLVANRQVTQEIRANKEKMIRVASQRRHKSQVEAEKQFQKTCPFRPSINPVSQAIVREKLEVMAKQQHEQGKPAPVKKPTHEVLYEDSFVQRQQQQLREEEAMKQYPFKPDIGVSMLWKSHSDTNSSSARDSSDEPDVVQRLAVTRYEEMEAKREALLAKYASTNDPITGKPLFQPEVGRSPLFNRNEKKLKIGDFLYQSRVEQQEYKRRLEQEEQRKIHQQSNQCFVSTKSQQTLQLRKQRAFDYLFDFLVNAAEMNSMDMGYEQERSGAGSDKRESGELTQDQEHQQVFGNGSDALNGSSAVQHTDKADDETTFSLIQEQERLQDTKEQGHEPLLDLKRLELDSFPEEVANVVIAMLNNLRGATTMSLTRQQFHQQLELLRDQKAAMTYTQMLALSQTLKPDAHSRRPSAVSKRNSVRTRRNTQRSKLATGLGFEISEEDELDEEDARELTLKPAIDHMSVAITQCHGRAPQSQVFEILHHQHHVREERIDQLRREQFREFQEQHPFHPTLVAKSHRANHFYERLQARTSDATTKLHNLRDQTGFEQDESPSLVGSNIRFHPQVRPIGSSPVGSCSKPMTTTTTTSSSSSSSPPN